MKTKSKKPTKKSVKVNPGISRTTQLTFVIAAVAAYVMQTVMSIQGLLSMPNILESFERWFPVYLFDSIVSPLILFVFTYFVLKGSSSKVSRIFKATLVASIGIILSTTSNVLLMELFRAPIGLDGSLSVWSTLWMQLVPAAIGLLGAAFIALYVFKSVKDKEFTASRKVQKVFIGLVVFALGSNTILGIVSMFNGANSGYASSGEAFAALGFSILATFVPVVVLYLIASKVQTKLTRLFNALLYMLVLISVSSLVFTVMYSFKIYMHEPGSFGAVLMPIVTLVAVTSLVVVQKLQKAF